MVGEIHGIHPDQFLYIHYICVVFDLLRGPTRVHGYIWSASVSGLTWSGACSPWIWTRGFTLQPVV